VVAKLSELAPPGGVVAKLSELADFDKLRVPGELRILKTIFGRKLEDHFLHHRGSEDSFSVTGPTSLTYGGFIVTLFKSIL
jgi:hypothetical protein